MSLSRKSFITRVCGFFGSLFFLRFKVSAKKTHIITVGWAVMEDSSACVSVPEILKEYLESCDGRDPASAEVIRGEYLSCMNGDNPAFNTLMAESKRRQEEYEEKKRLYPDLFNL